MKPMRYAHSDGHTDVCYDDSGRYMLTCGADGDVRIWAGVEDDDAVSHRVGDRTTAIAFKEERFFTASDDNSVQRRKFPDGMPDGLITRFTAPVTHFVLNSSGSVMVAGSSDFTVKVVQVETSIHKVFRGHKAPVLSVALDPKEMFVASASCDGTVQVWGVEDQEAVKSLQLLESCSDVSLAKTLCRMCWSKDGEILFVPVQKEIHSYARGTWDCVDKITSDEFSAAINVLSLSPDGQYLMAACMNGVMAVVDVQKRQVLEKRKHERSLTITSVAWSPTNKSHLAFCDLEGQLGLLEDLLQSKDGKAEAASAALGMEGVFDDDDDMLIQASCTADRDGNSDDDDSESVDLGAIKKSLMPIIMGDEDSNAADSVIDGGEGGRSSSPAPRLAPPVVVEGWKPTPMQKAFQPGSTPEHLASRFMKWNSVGIIRQYNTDDESSIDIEFHNTATHHAMHISNTSDFSMADLSSEAVVLATSSDEEMNSKLMCMHFGSWDNAKEWSTTMPEGEVIQAVTAGEGWVAVATSMRMVRIFTVAGVQRSSFSLPGPVICLVAHGQKLLAIYHAGMAIPGDQNLGSKMVAVQGEQPSGQEAALPLSPKATLSWAGFSTEGTPFTMDSDGVVRMLNTGLSLSWTMVANTRDQVKGKSDHYWIVGIDENPQQLRCIPCKGSRYPATLPRPAVAILPFCLSLCEPTSEKSQYEEAFQRSMLFAQHLSSLGSGLDEEALRSLQRPMQEALVKLFALSVRGERETRAMEVCELMPDDQTLQLALKYATRQRRLPLAQRISQLTHQRQQEQEQDSEEPEWAGRGDQEAREETVAHDDEASGDEAGEEAAERKSSGPMLNVNGREKLVKQQSMGRSNPFKIASQEKVSSVKGSQVFDCMKKAPERAPVISPLPITIKKSKGGQNKITVQGKTPKQPKIAFGGGSEADKTTKESAPEDHVKEHSENEPEKKPASAFELWLAASQGDLAEEHPDLGEEEMGRVAAETFRALPREDRQVWLQKAKSQPQADKGASQKKRKLSEDEEPAKSKKKAPNSPSKKPLSQTTNSKLASFAFK